MTNINATFTLNCISIRLIPSLNLHKTRRDECTNFHRDHLPSREDQSIGAVFQSSLVNHNHLSLRVALPGNSIFSSFGFHA